MERDDKKAEDPWGATVGPGSPAEPFAGTGTGTGVTTSGVRPVAGGGAAGGGTATAKLMAIYDDIEDELRGHMFGLGVKSRNLEDAVQRLITGVVRHVMTTEELPDKPKAYLFKAAENVANYFLNEQLKHLLVAGDDGEGEIPAPSSRQGMFQTRLRAERMELVEKGLAMLSPEDREIIRKVYFEGLTREEIAEDLGIGLDAAKKRCQRALARLRDAVLGDCTQDDMEEGAA